MTAKFLRNSADARFSHPPNAPVFDIEPEPLRPWHKLALFVAGMCGTLLVALVVAVFAGVV